MALLKQMGAASNKITSDVYFDAGRASALCDAELLAFLIGSDTVRQTAVALPKMILADLKGDLKALSRLPVAKVVQIQRDWNG